VPSPTPAVAGEVPELLIGRITAPAPPLQPPDERQIQPGASVVHSNHVDIISINYSINLTVEDMDEAVAYLRMMGFEIESSNVSEWGSFFVLNVPVYQFEHAKFLAAALGEVSSEWEGRNDLTRQTNDLAVRYLARLEESRRLAALITRAERAEDILTLQRRISDVEHDRAWIRGSYNRNLEQAQGVSMSIILNPVSRPFYHIERSFSERVSGAFASSVNFTTGTFEGLLVFGASAVVPLGLIAGVSAIVYFVYKKSKRAKVTPPEGGHEHVENE